MSKRKLTPERRVATERKRVLVSGHTSDCQLRDEMPHLGSSTSCSCLQVATRLNVAVIDPCPPRQRSSRDDPDGTPSR